MHRLRWHWKELLMIVTGGSATHRLLRDRLVSLAIGTLVMDVVFSIAVLFAERRAAGSGIVDYGDALFWTTCQLLSVSSNLTAPLSATGRCIDVVLEVWAISVVASLAGSFGSFFHRRGMERHPITTA